MCNDEKLLKCQLQNKKKAKYEMGNFCEQYGLPPIASSRQKGKKHDKSYKNYSHKKYKKHKTNFVKPNDFYAKKKNVTKKWDKQSSSKGKCFNCGKSGHFSKDCNKPYWKERIIDDLPPIFAHKVKQELVGKNDSIDYDSLTYGDILSTIKKLYINMCNDEKLLKYQLQNKRKAKYEMGNFCEQYGLPPIAPSS